MNNPAMTGIADELDQHHTNSGNTGCTCGWESPQRGNHRVWLEHVADSLTIPTDVSAAFAAGRQSVIDQVRAKRAEERG